MARQHPYTYNVGGTWQTGPTFSTHDVARLCQELSAAMGPGHVIIPEPITEGGLLWFHWPGKRPREYKSVRFLLEGVSWPMPFQWPMVTDVSETGAATWLAEPARPLGEVKKGGVFCFKAFGGASVWTRAEQALLARILTAHGMKARIPVKCKRIDHGELGRPPLGAAPAVTDEPPAKKRRLE